MKITCDCESQVWTESAPSSADHSALVTAHHALVCYKCKMAVQFMVQALPGFFPPPAPAVKHLWRYPDGPATKVWCENDDLTRDTASSSLLETTCSDCLSAVSDWLDLESTWLDRESTT